MEKNDSWYFLTIGMFLLLCAGVVAAYNTGTDDGIVMENERLYEKCLSVNSALPHYEAVSTCRKSVD